MQNNTNRYQYNLNRMNLNKLMPKSHLGINWTPSWSLKYSLIWI